MNGNKLHLPQFQVTASSNPLWIHLDVSWSMLNRELRQMQQVL